MIIIDHLVKTFGTNYAVDDVSFEIKKGEVVGFLGPNGAGKSTVMNIITGYLSSTSGTVKIDGIDVLENPLATKKMVGYLPEQPPLYLDLTVEEYLGFTYELKGCSYNREKHLREICEIVKITDVYKRVIKNLSKGYRQRVGIAQALVGNPEIIIFDEPTIGLDPKQIIEIRNLIRTLGRDHTVILSTHILQEVQACCDRIIIINKGRIVADELTENISRAVGSNRRFNLKICGPQREVLAMLKAVGHSLCRGATTRDGDANVYMIESKSGRYPQEPVLHAGRENWPLVGLESLGMNLEDIFITIVDHANEQRGRRESRKKKPSPAKSAIEQEVAQAMLDKTAKTKTSEIAGKSRGERR